MQGKAAGLLELQNLFTEYTLASSQRINANKSTIFSGSISQQRLLNIATMFGFNIGTLPFIYLGAPIFKGKPKKIHFQPIADRIKLKLSAWKASLLSIAGRVQLVKVVVQGMLVHTLSIYSWSVTLLKDFDKCIRNFIWSGDIEKRKLITVSWKKVCKTEKKGGLGVTSLVSLNEAANLKLCWELISSKNDKT